MLDVKGTPDGEVYAGIRPEGFVISDSGKLCCKLSGVEVMGRDISVLSVNENALVPTVRSIISSENRVDTSKETVCFDLKPNKVFLFDKTTEKRIYFGEI